MGTCALIGGALVALPFYWLWKYLSYVRRARAWYVENGNRR